eukprot:364619-Chlamydomonas_euryale.AAC.3
MRARAPAPHLQVWEPPVLELFDAVGNTLANEVWEARLGLAPAAAAPRAPGRPLSAGPARHAQDRPSLPGAGSVAAAAPGHRRGGVAGSSDGPAVDAWVWGDEDDEDDEDERDSGGGAWAACWARGLRGGVGGDKAAAWMKEAIHGGLGAELLGFGQHSQESEVKRPHGFKSSESLEEGFGAARLNGFKGSKFKGFKSSESSEDFGLKAGNSEVWGLRCCEGVRVGADCDCGGRPRPQEQALTAGAGLGRRGRP